jgi:YVTN family beta-propeller protein
VPYIRLTILVVSLVLPAVAHAADGGVYVYLQPLPSEAARLSFSLASLTAVAASGVEHSVALNLRDVEAASAGRQRLLASGRLPAGTYTRLTLILRRASVKGRESVSLAVPDTPTPIDVPFSVAPKRSPVVWLTLKYAESMGVGGVFTPVFLAVTPSNPIGEHSAFVTNSRSDTVTVIDTNLSQVTGMIETCSGPAGMALDQLRRRLYVACAGDDEIQVIDVATDEVIERTRVSPGDRPRELALTPDGATLLVVNNGSDSVSLFDALSLARGERINVGGGPQSLVVEASGRRAFVFNSLSGSVSIVDIQNRTLAGTISTEAAPLRGVLNRRGDRLFVIHERSPYMTVLDPRQLTLVARARLRVGINAIAIDPVRDLVCVGGDSDTAIDFYDPNALLPIYSMKTPDGVFFLGIDGVDNRVYVVSRKARSVAVGQLASRKITSEIDVGEDPYWVAVMGAK